MFTGWDDRGTLTTKKSIAASPLAEKVSAILKPIDGSVSANTSRSVRSSSQVLVGPPDMPHRSTLARSTANGNVRMIVTGPKPGSRTATSAGFSMPFTDTRTTLPGSRRGDGADVTAVNRGVASVGVGGLASSVEDVLHAESTPRHASKPPRLKR